MKELEKIKEAAEKMNAKGSLDSCLEMKEDDSYYDKNCTTQYLQTLEIDTPIQLQGYLNNLWNDSKEAIELRKLIVVTAFKLRENKIDRKEKIKDRIYNF